MGGFLSPFYFRLFEAYKHSGPYLPKNELLIAVNSNGVYLMGEGCEVMQWFSYAELSSVSCNK